MLDNAFVLQWESQDGAIDESPGCYTSPIPDYVQYHDPDVDAPKLIRQ